MEMIIVNKKHMYFRTISHLTAGSTLTGCPANPQTGKYNIEALFLSNSLMFPVTVHVIIGKKSYIYILFFIYLFIYLFFFFLGGGGEDGEGDMIGVSISARKSVG